MSQIVILDKMIEVPPNLPSWLEAGILGMGDFIRDEIRLPVLEAYWKREAERQSADGEFLSAQFAKRHAEVCASLHRELIKK